MNVFCFIRIFNSVIFLFLYGSKSMDKTLCFTRPWLMKSRGNVWAMCFCYKPGLSTVNNSKDKKTPPGFPGSSFTLHCCSIKKWYIIFFFSALVYKSRMSVHFHCIMHTFFPQYYFFVSPFWLSIQYAVVRRNNIVYQHHRITW